MARTSSSVRKLGSCSGSGGSSSSPSEVEAGSPSEEWLGLLGEDSSEGGEDGGSF